MHKLIVVLTIITLALGGYAVWQARQLSALPDVLVLGGTVYDVGMVSANKTIVHTFNIENPHPFAVGLDAPTAGCTCTTATVSASFIPAHGAATVTLRVEPEANTIAGSASLITTHGRKSTETWLFITRKPLPPSPGRTANKRNSKP